MSEEKVKEKELKKLSKEILVKQIQQANEIVKQAQEQIIQLQNRVQQEIGIAGLAKHYLDTFELPEKIEEKKSLEVQ